MESLLVFTSRRKRGEEDDREKSVTIVENEVPNRHTFYLNKRSFNGMVNPCRGPDPIKNKVIFNEGRGNSGRWLSHDLIYCKNINVGSITNTL